MTRTCVAGCVLAFLFISSISTTLTTAGQQAVLRPVGNSLDREQEYILNQNTLAAGDEAVYRVGPLNLNPGVIDTLSWRTLPVTWATFIFANPGDSAAMWFRPSAACTLKAIRVHFNSAFGVPSAGNVLLDIRESRYDGHIMTLDSTDAFGWVGTHEGGQWIPGPVMGRSPLGEHIWGPFPLTLNESMSDTWVEIPTYYVGEPNLTAEPFFVTMVFYPITRIGIGMENQYSVPYHFFKYYADCCGPDGLHDGWFLRSFSIWVEAIVSYYENTPPEISDMSVLNYTYRPGPFSVEAEIEDRDAEDPGRAGVASAYLHWNMNGVSDSTVMSGPTEGGTFTGQIPQITAGDTVRYYISATDEAGVRSSTDIETFARLKPTNPHADILLVGYGDWWTNASEFYRQLLDSIGYMYEYWDVQERQGIDESVSMYGWRTVIIFGFDEWTPIPYMTPPLPTREYEGNIWANFLSAGIPEALANLFYAESQYWNLNQEYGELEFQSGDFAYDYFGCASAEECDGLGCTDKVFYGVPGDPITGIFTEDPFRQTWPLEFGMIYWITYTTAAETGVDIFFTESGQGSGLRFDGGTFRTVFLPWDFYTLLEDTGTDTVPSADVRVLMKMC
ncbi:MAG: hypothetical protein ACE5OR_01650 [bacterium]